MSLMDEREALSTIIESLEGFEVDVIRRVMGTVATFFDIEAEFPKPIMVTPREEEV